MRSVAQQFQSANSKAVRRLCPLIDTLIIDQKYLPAFYYLTRNVYFIECTNSKIAGVFSKSQHAKVVTQECILFGGVG